MKTPAGTFRTTAYLLFVLLISAALAACSGGGSTSSSGGSASSSVGVSVASAPSYPAGTTFASSTSSPVTAAPPGNTPPNFSSVFVTVTKLALIPSSGTEFPDGGGEFEVQDSPSEKGNGFVTESFSPVTFDLLNPNSSTGDNVATLLNKFTNVPAGEYSKIRVYYDNVVGMPGDTVFHPTAHYHFDVHFVGGNLVIPEATDPEGGIKFFSVEIDVVGLKYHQAGQSGNVLLRPQVFAKVVGVPRYIVTGEAAQVNHEGGTFVVMAAHDNISVNYGSGAKWFYFDERYVGPFVNSGADNALRNTAHVDVIGTFEGGDLTAEEVRITFPNVLTGNVSSVGWKGDNTFDLRPPVPAGDNTVFPMPARTSAYYDNAVDYGRLSDINISDNAAIIARGYHKETGGINAYWISIGP